MRIGIGLVTMAVLAALAASAAACRTDGGRDASVPDGAPEADASRGADAAPPAAQPEIAAQPEVAAATNDFAASEGIDPTDVRVIAVTPVTWPDSALGCPSPGELYTQALVPGFEVRLSAGSRTAVYHTNRGLSGAIAVRRCGDGDGRLVAPSDDPVVLERIRGDLLGRAATGSATGSGPDGEPVLERRGPAQAASLVCPGTAEAPAEGGALTLQQAVSEVVFRLGADRHLYRVWNGQFVYCGIAPPEAPVAFGTPTPATD